MSRYIDADKLIERLKFKRDTDTIDRNKYSGLECAIAQCKKAPTADVVEVVRCKDCKHYKGEQSNCWLMRAKMQPTDYCSYGERREENER